MFFSSPITCGPVLIDRSSPIALSAQDRPQFRADKLLLENVAHDSGAGVY
jgi:hypothetical protein